MKHLRYSIFPAGFLLLSMVFVSCIPSRHIQPQRDQEAIRMVMRHQEIAWNNGDIEGFMQGYWKSDQLRFVGRSGLKYGWENTLQGYKKGYPDKATMGKLHFEIDDLEPTGPDSYYMIGRYELIRKEDHPTGYFTLLWKRINGKWKIVSDMTCG